MGTGWGCDVRAVLDAYCSLLNLSYADAFLRYPLQLEQSLIACAQLIERGPLGAIAFPRRDVYLHVYQ